MLHRIGKILMPWRAWPARVAIVRLGGIIAAGGRFGSGLSLGPMAGVLEAAFSAPGLKAVALLLNSPGGSPAQSHLLFKRIRALAQEKELPVLAFVEDVAASGGYMLACAADEIFADESSILGSIGVVTAGFGFQGLIEKLGVERRVHTAGTRKAALDPFRPEDPQEVERLLEIQREVHRSFIALVKARRGERLKGSEPELFSGEFWVGRQAQELGLIDGIGDAKTVLKARFGDKVRLLPFAPARGLFGLRPGKGGVGQTLPGAFEEGLALLEGRALWSRFGL
jgi:serine protease SohB